MLLLLLGLVSATIDYSSTTFPFPDDALTTLDTNTDAPSTNCSVFLIGDGKCDEVNNYAICNYDGGDCCRPSCEKNCQSGCPYACGSRGYFCKVSTQCSNCQNGTCNPMSSCFSTSESVKLGINNCLRNNIAHGNSSTADFYCGLDINKTIVHTFDSLAFHYPGCGLNASLCSTYQCCTDLIENNVTAETCDDTPRNATAYNPYTYRTEEVYMSCLEQFAECFFNNSQTSKGECCECNEGWVGRDCDIPTCLPACIYGSCVSINTCNCSLGWTGNSCNQALCSNCINGDCIGPEICQCWYGWNGTSCNVTYATPPCINGISIAPDVCQCESNYTGDRCEVPVCTECNHGWCVSPNICECYPPYYTVNVTGVWCTDLYCNEIFGAQCTNCTNSTCTTCQTGFFLNNSVCIPCSFYDVNCIQCSSQCDLCQWPYAPNGFGCSYPGYLEFSSKYYTVTKNNGTTELLVYRIGPAVNRTEVSYKITPITASYIGIADFGYKEGSLYFDPGVTSQKIVLEIYNSFFDKTGPTTFYAMLYNPVAAVIPNTNLSSILDYSWSDTGISIVSYCTVEIWDSPSQALPTLTSFFQQYPATIHTNQAYTMNFTAFNSNNLEITSAVFVISVRQVINTIPKETCVFSTANFSSDSTFYGYFKASVSGNSYFYMFSAARGMYTLTPNVALPGVYVKIYTNEFLTGNIAEQGVRGTVGQYNNYTMPMGNSSSEWNFAYFPSVTITASINISCNTTDLVTLYVNEVLGANCVGSCSSTSFSFIVGEGYNFYISYVHYGNYPGFYVTLSSPSGIYKLSEIYALNSTGKIGDVYVLDSNEC